MPRKYQLKRRAERQEATRQRIIEATVALHEQGGDAIATRSAVAERAGVERKTVYRHFPDERSLLTACTEHYLAVNPPPDPASWAAIDDPTTRLRTALGEVYAYHRRTERMFVQAQRDLPDNPILRDLLTPYFALWGLMRDVLVRDRRVGDEQRSMLLAAIGHALSFVTWRSLAVDQGLNDAASIDLMVGMIRSIDCGPRAGGG